MSKSRMTIRDKRSGYKDDQSDKYSETSTDHSYATEDDLSVDDIRNVSQYIDNLSDKRSKIRSESLVNILKLLRSSESDIIVDSKDSITDALSQLFRRGISSEKEGGIAIEVYVVLCLYLGANEQKFLDTFQPFLINISTRCQYEHLRSSAIMAISFSHLVCSNLIDDKVVSFVEDVLCKESEALEVSQLLQSSAALAWCLLSTAIPRQNIIDRSRDRVFEEIVKLLVTGTVDVKIIAGLCLAYLWEVAGVDEETAGLEPYQIGLILSTNGDLVQQALDEIIRVSKDCSKRVSKKDRKEQRTAFREVQAWIINGEAPEDTIHFQGAMVECNSFAKLILVDAIRGALGDGFTAAIRLFPVVRELLEIHTVTDHKDGDGSDRRVKKGSAAARTRTTQRKQDRSYRNTTTHFESFTLDEDDS